MLSRGLTVSGLRGQALHLEGNSDKKKQERLESSDFRLVSLHQSLIEDTISSGLAALSVPAQSTGACISTIVTQEK